MRYCYECGDQIEGKVYRGREWTGKVNLCRSCYEAWVVKQARNRRWFIVLCILPFALPCVLALLWGLVLFIFVPR